MRMCRKMPAKFRCPSPPGCIVPEMGGVSAGHMAVGAGVGVGEAVVEEDEMRKKNRAGVESKERQIVVLDKMIEVMQEASDGDEESTAAFASTLRACLDQRAATVEVSMLS